ncbi:hypothetical protein LXL04_020340 [Taraxacum kok-saghyz]
MMHTREKEEGNGGGQPLVAALVAGRGESGSWSLEYYGGAARVCDGMSGFPETHTPKCSPTGSQVYATLGEGNDMKKKSLSASEGFVYPGLLLYPVVSCPKTSSCGLGAIHQIEACKGNRRSMHAEESEKACKRAEEMELIEEMKEACKRGEEMELIEGMERIEAMELKLNRMWYGESLIRVGNLKPDQIPLPTATKAAVAGGSEGSERKDLTEEEELFAVGLQLLRTQQEVISSPVRMAVKETVEVGEQIQHTLEFNRSYTSRKQQKKSKETYRERKKLSQRRVGVLPVAGSMKESCPRILGSRCKGRYVAGKTEHGAVADGAFEREKQKYGGRVFGSGRYAKKKKRRERRDSLLKEPDA